VATNERRDERHEESRRRAQAPNLATDGERRQKALADLGLLALRGAELPALLAEAAERVREVLNVELSSVMELLPERDALRLRQGSGWDEGHTGHTEVAVGFGSPADHVSQLGYTLISNGPVCVEDLRQDPRFGQCPLTRAHAVVSGVTVKVYGGERLFGVLGAYSRTRRCFTQDEACWLADVAEILGGALTCRSTDRVDEARERCARAWRKRADVLQDTMEVVAASSGGRQALVATAKMAVAEIADWCFVDLVEEKDGVPGFTAGDIIHRLVVGADLRVPKERELADHLSYPLDPAAPHGTPKVLRSGEPELIPVVEDDVLRESATDEAHLQALRKLNPRSYMVVPMRLTGRPVGALVLVSTDPARRFGEQDLERAKDLARCAALVLAGQRASSLPGDWADATTLSQEGGPTIVNAPHRPPHPNGRSGTANGRPENLVPGLQRRQVEVLRLLHDGLPRKEIAKKVYCSEETVKWHIKRAKGILGVAGQGDGALLAAARRLGLFGDPS
jgi:GAF domain-containing protein/DNA-binding CsgD family transcriptional regulator